MKSFNEALKEQMKKIEEKDVPSNSNEKRKISKSIAKNKNKVRTLLEKKK